MSRPVRLPLRLLLRALIALDRATETFRAPLRRRLRARRPLAIVAYRGYGTAERVWLTGRVVARVDIPPAGPEDSAWRNLRWMLARVRSAAVPRARVKVSIGGAEIETRADNDGYFEAELRLPRPLPAGRDWHEVSLELLSPARRQAVRAVGEVLVPRSTARLAVLSDIDDTVLHTDVASLLRMARAVLLGNAHTRLPFPGVGALFRALSAGDDGEAGNPVVFVSRSPWNIYDVLCEFFALHGFPKAVVLLRDWGLEPAMLRPREEHKLRLIRNVMAYWPHLPFVLIGDSGQEDPEIYQRTVAEHPGRVLAVWIRNVGPRLARSEEVRGLAAELLRSGAPLILADDTAAMAADAATRRWIARQALPDILADKAHDEGPPNALERVFGPRSPSPTVVVEGGDEQLVEEGAIERAIEQGSGREAPTVVIRPEPPEGPREHR